MPPFAVNIADMTRDEFLASFLLAPLIERREVVEAEPKRGDGQAVVLDDVEPEQFEGLVATVRMKYGPNEFRFYERRGSRWVRV